MERYEANRNSSQKKLESTKKVVDEGGKLVLDAYTGGQGSKILETAEKVPIVGGAVKNTWDNAVDKVSKVASRTPLGNVFKKADDVGITDAAKTVSSMYRGSQGNFQNGGDVLQNKSEIDNSKFSGLKLGVNKATSTNGDLVGNLWAKLPPSIKIKVAVGCGVCLLFLLMITTIFAADDVQNLSLTNVTNISGSSVASRKCSTEEVENKLLYVGDSRTVGMQSSLENQNINYIAEVGKGYEWFNSTALASIESTLQSKSDAVIVLSLGVNDLYNIDNYISAYKTLIAKYPSNTFYVLSVNPVDESKTSTNGYTITNVEIEAFNKKLADNFPNNYIDSYSSLTNIGTSDGLHYDNETYKSLNGIVTSNISSSGKVMCGASGDLAVSLEEVANWYIQNVAKYDQTLYVDSPFSTSQVRADCSGFAVAYMSYVSGADIPISNSAGMIDPNGQWAQSVSQYGWKAYSSDTVGTLQTGDILIAHAGSLYSTKGRHAEIYIDESSTFGWGSVKSQYPTSKSIQTTNSGGHVHFMDSTHDYITIYRYEG